MNFKKLYLDTSEEINHTIARKYSTSFSIAIKLIDKSIRNDIYNIYGFVRVPDELVDTLRPIDCKEQLEGYVEQTYSSMKTGVSSNPVIHAFVATAKKYSIPKSIIQPFFDSMLSDINKKNYTDKEYKKYIYGSAEVVGLMCLMVFVDGDKKLFNKLEPSASALGSAFQKVNFLRDFQSDNINLGRVYFPDIDINKLTPESKLAIQKDIGKDLETAKKMIQQLPISSRYGVKLAYYYYHSLYKKIVRLPSEELLSKRIRVHDSYKILLFIILSIQKLLRI